VEKGGVSGTRDGRCRHHFSTGLDSSRPFTLIVEPTVHEITTYRQPRGNWICMGACALVLSGVVVLAGVAIVLEGLDLVTLLLTVFVVCLSAYADWIALEMARTRIDVGYDWIEKRAPFRRPRRVAFAEITAFSERRGLLRLGAHVSEFRVFTASGPPLTFTSQFVG
jgi:hypothetical protein